jgi:hypothetical protein
VSKQKKIDIYWFTITYRKLVFWGVLLVVLFALATLPFVQDPVKKFIASQAQRLLDDDSSSQSPGVSKTGGFAIIKGAVKVKKSSSNQWISADYQTKLETGDYIQTSSDGNARIQFPDGTTYDLKPDSLLAVQENSENPQTQLKKVSIRVTSGAVDLLTSKREGTTRSEVSAASAVAVLSQDTRMAVEMNPVSRTSQFLVSRGQALLRHQNGASTEVNPYESVTVTQSQMVKEKVLAPPDLVSPESDRPLTSRQGPATQIHFSWKPVPKASAYRIRISNSQIFSKIIREETIHGKTAYSTAGFNEGTYYWGVSSIDEVNKQSSGFNDPPGKFTLFYQTGDANETSPVSLSIGRVYRMGNYYTVTGQTTPGNTVIINDEPVLTETDGTFKQVTSPVPHKGRFLISVTAQDRSGNSKTIPYFVEMD